nr:MAG: nonstructural protein 1 [Protoparvovirus sp.]
MECTGRTRYFHWAGSSGTSRDLSISQTKNLLITKDYVARPLPILEPHLRNLDMKSFQGCILQMATQDGTPIENPEPYILLLNELINVDNWIISGERNKDFIFHTHCMIKTSARSDSQRRSLNTAFQNLKLTETMFLLCNGEPQFDCLKIQRAYRPSSLMMYICKNPEWIVSNHDPYLQMTYDINTHDLNARFKTEEGPEISPEMNSMSKELTEAITTHNCKSLEDLMRVEPAIISKYLHKPGLLTIVQNCLSFVKATRGTWSLHTFSEFDPNPETIHKYLLHQGINPTHFDETFHSWITKQSGKKNTLLLLGPSNTGKTSFISNLKKLVSWGEVVNGSNFNYEALVDCYLGIYEEPLISPENAEKFKQIAGGEETSIAIKYKKPHILPRTPLLMTSNHVPWRFCTAEQKAMENRMFIFHCNQPVLNVHYYPRTSNTGCKCRYCQASTGSSSPISSTESTAVPRTEQSICTGELSTRTISQSEMGTGPLLDPGEGTSRGPITSITDSRSTNTSSTTCSSSTGIERFFRSQPEFRPINTRDRIYNSGSMSKQHVESGQHRTDHERNMGGNGTTGGRIGPRNGNTLTEHNYPTTMGTKKRHKTQQKIPISSKQSKMDRTLGAKVGANKLDMYIPDKSDWQEYLSFIYHIYG